MIHHPATMALPSLIVAQSAATAVDAGPWANTLINSGAIGCWLLYMLWRDKRDSEKQDKRHDENLAAMKKVENAFRVNTESIIVGIASLKTIDGGYAELLSKIRESNSRDQ